MGTGPTSGTLAGPSSVFLVGGAGLICGERGLGQCPNVDEHLA
jgi:hypothetical protein